jgi:hypothetical protein
MASMTAGVAILAGEGFALLAAGCFLLCVAAILFRGLNHD